MINFFGTACGLMAAVPAMGAVLLPRLMQEPGSGLGWGFGGDVVTLIASLAVGFLAMTLARGLGLAFAVRIVRGRQYVAWAPPSSCASFTRWVFYSWGFYGNRGMQVGERNFGIEVAIVGELS